jgi:hypothetical protein
MFNYKHYIPVLKGKRAEFPAIGTLKSRAGVTPLFEAVPSADPEEVPRRMSSTANWPQKTPYFIDLFFFDDPDDTTEPAPQSHPLRRCFAEVEEQGQEAIPVTGLARSPGYQSAVQQVVAEGGTGLALRLTVDDFEGADYLDTAITAATAYFGLEPSNIDLIIDLGSVANSSSGVVAQMHRANIDLLPNLMDWRTLTVLASAFPLGLGDLDRNEWNVAMRHDWAGWVRLTTGPRRPRRLPSFGDYAIAHPDLPPEGRATILAQLRYTISNAWLIWKGANVFTQGFAQFNSICHDLINRCEFRGAAFSQGDADIQSKATTDDSPGNAETWRRIGTNHHIETVLDQLASLL